MDLVLPHETTLAQAIGQAGWAALYLGVGPNVAPDGAATRTGALTGPALGTRPIPQWRSVRYPTA